MRINIVSGLKKNSEAHLLSAGVHVDLKPYIDAHQSYVNYIKYPDTSVEFQRESQRLESEFRVLNKEYTDEIRAGHLIWLDLLNKACDGLDKEKKAALMESPALLILNNSFVEILKNCMDEIILGYCDSVNKKATTEVQLSLNIRYDLDKNTITVEMADNGRGFSPGFLNKISTPDKRLAYITTDRESSPKYGIQDIPNLFGGAGRGLPMLIAKVEHGADLDVGGRLKFKEHVTPLSSAIDFKNNDPTGAVISVTTTISTRKRMVVESIVDEQLDHSETAPLHLPPKRVKKECLKQQYNLKDQINALKDTHLNEEKKENIRPTN